MSMGSKLSLALVGVALFAVAAFAQADRGSITGTIKDPAGAVVQNANVQAVNSETDAQYKTVSTETGNYTLAQMPAGVYSVTVEVPGFKKFVQQGIRVEVATVDAIDIALEVGAATDTVTVTADAPLLRTESSDQSFNMTSSTVNSIPLNFALRGPNGQVGNVRNAYSFLDVAPGAYISGQSDIRVNGNPLDSQKTMVEGQEAGNWQTGRPDQVEPSIDALQEITTQTSNFAAEYGQVAGGLFNLTSKSGTNQFHGGGYDYFQNEALNAGIPFTNNGNGGLVRPAVRKNDFGGNIGGPVVIPHVYNGHDKTFFFFNMEMYRETRNNSGTYITVPTAAMRAGDFSKLLTGKNLATDTQGNPILENTLYDPATEQTVNSAVVRTPFPGNIIPASRFDPVSAKIQAFLPLPSNSNQTNNYNQIFQTFRYQYIPSVKFDHIFHDNSKLSIYWTHFRTHHLTGSVSSLPDALPTPVTATREIRIRTQTLRASYDRTITPTLLFHIGAGFMYQTDPDIAVPDVLNFNSVTQLGLQGAVANGFPNISGLSSSYGGMSNTFGLTNANWYTFIKPTGVASASYVRGSHTYKMGAEWRQDSFINENTQGSEGAYVFSALETGLPSTNGQSLNGGTVGFPYASFLLGAADSASLQSPQQPLIRKQAWGLFIQDSWKVTQKLTFDYGLRWDRETAPLVNNRMSTFGPTVPNPSAGGLLGGVLYEGNGAGTCNCSLATTYPFAIGPRLGVAYQINSKTVFRGGWGLSYGPTYTVGTFNSVNGIGGWNILYFTSPAYGDPAVLLRQGLQYNPATLYGNSLNPGIQPLPGQVGTAPAFIDRNAGRPPRINQWSAGIQRQITTNLMIEAAYVGNRGVWMNAPNMMDLNGITPQRLAAYGLNLANAADRTVLTSRLSSAAAIARGFTAPYAGFPMNQTVAQSLRPYPQFGNISIQQAPLGNSWYDSLQAKVTKRFSHGLNVQSAFT
jgi:Carboxypeptidase regulatory-like domain/TonB dependent receptor